MSQPDPYGSTPYGSRPGDDPWRSSAPSSYEGATAYPYSQPPQNPYDQHNPYEQQPYQQHPYGTPTYGAVQPYPGPMAAPQRTNGLAIASLVLSCCGLFTGITAPVGMVLGFIAMAQVKRDETQTGWGLALAGTIVGGAMTVLGILGILLYVVLIGVMVGVGQY